MCEEVCVVILKHPVIYTWFNEGKHSGPLYVMSLRAYVALLQSEAADFPTYVSCRQLQGLNEAEEKLFSSCTQQIL